jgi:hypothetical protein
VRCGIAVLDDRFFNQCVVRDEAAKLRAILRAIPKWQAIALEEIATLEANSSESFSSAQQHWRSEFINDQHYLADQTANALFAGLAVSAAAVVESTLGMLCAEQGVVFPNNRPGWGEKRQGLEGVLGTIRLDTLASFGHANRARLLGNCFKHNGGKTNQDWVRAFGGAESQEIQYVDEDWAAMIAGVQDFLLDLVRVLPVT